MTEINRNDHDRLPAGLHIVATPIGNARDITLRALDVLNSAEIILAEDTRRLRRLLQIHGIELGKRPLWAYHDRNGTKVRPKILAALREGKSIALTSDAGTPLIADPGYKLVAEARDMGLAVTTAPGVSALTTAVSMSGLASDRIFFAGFLSSSQRQRQKQLTELQNIAATLVLYEAPHRIKELLQDACDIIGADRVAAIGRELTKTFEELRRGTLGALLEDNFIEKGEFVLLIEKGCSRNVPELDIEKALYQAMQRMTLRDAAKEVAQQTGQKRRDVYQLGLSLLSTPSTDDLED